MKPRKQFALGSWISLLAISTSAHATSLSLENYLDQVKNKNTGYQAAIQSSEGFQDSSSDYNLATSAVLFGQLSFTSDGKPPTVPLISYDRINSVQWNLGVQKTFVSGTQLKAYYLMIYSTYENPTSFLARLPGFSLSAFPLSFYIMSPTIEVSQSLWKNFFGRTTRAERDAVEAQNLAQSYGARFQAKAALVQAETTYYRMLLARQSIEIAQQALERAQKIHDWNQRRVKLNLADRADAIQSEALVKLRQMELQSTKDEERSASLAFNSARGANEILVKETLDATLLKNVDKIALPKRSELRDDTKAALEQQRAARAQALINKDKGTPSVELFGSISGNGFNGDAAESFKSSFMSNRATGTIGVRFGAPLDFLTAYKSQEGWKKQELAADLNVDRKKMDQEQSWIDLSERLTEAKRRYSLVTKVEEIQNERLENERRRLSQARTITLQVLMAESDFLTAQLNRLRSTAEILTLVAQMKLFGE